MSAELEHLAASIAGRPIVALTGAGVSTESGIPDYRGPDSTARRARNPMQYRGFAGSAEACRRYWARSLLGWQRVAAAEPNPAHQALAEMEEGGALVGLITQNVDRLHLAAGSQRVVELHGALAEVRCLACAAIEPRAELQERLLELNPRWRAAPAEIAPDGDAELAEEAVADFNVADCRRCGGVLKPNVVFFGENVPRPRVETAYDLLGEAGALLVVGSSLAVFSGFRFVRRAAERGVPIAVINLGPTRGDAHASARVEAAAGEALPRLARALAPPAPATAPAG